LQAVQVAAIFSDGKAKKRNVLRVREHFSTQPAGKIVVSE